MFIMLFIQAGVSSYDFYCISLNSRMASGSNYIFGANHTMSKVTPAMRTIGLYNIFPMLKGSRTSKKAIAFSGLRASGYSNFLPRVCAGIPS